MLRRLHDNEVVSGRMKTENVNSKSSCYSQLPNNFPIFLVNLLKFLRYTVKTETIIPNLDCNKLHNNIF